MRRMCPPIPRMCIGKKVQLNATKVIQKWILPSVSFINRPNGDYTFTGQYTGNAAADFLLGVPIQFRQGSGDPNLDGSSWTYALYGQDEFRVGSRLTLNYGLRYEVNQPFAESQNHLNAFHPGQQSTVIPAAPTGLVYPGDAGVPAGIVIFVPAGI